MISLSHSELNQCHGCWNHGCWDLLRPVETGPWLVKQFAHSWNSNHTADVLMPTRRYIGLLKPIPWQPSPCRWVSPLDGKVKQMTQFTNPGMQLFHIPQCSIQNRNMHILFWVEHRRIWSRCILGFLNCQSLLYIWYMISADSVTVAQRDIYKSLDQYETVINNISHYIIS